MCCIFKSIRMLLIIKYNCTQNSLFYNFLNIMSRKKINAKESFNMKEFYNCHLCSKISDQIAKCSKDRCKLAFCFQCIVSKLNKDFLPSQYKKQFWICYACGGSCKCILCKGLVSQKRLKRPNQNHQNSSIQQSLQNIESVSKEKEKETPPPINKKNKPIKKISKKNKKNIQSQQISDKELNQSIQINIKYDDINQQNNHILQNQEEKVEELKKKNMMEEESIEQEDVNDNQKNQKRQENYRQVSQNIIQQQNIDINQSKQKLKYQSLSDQSKQDILQSSPSMQSDSQFQQIIQNKQKKTPLKIQKNNKFENKKSRRTQFQLLNAMHRTLQQPHVSQSSSQQLERQVYIDKSQYQIKKQWLNIDTKILKNRLSMNNLCLKVIFSKQNLKPQWQYALSKRKQIIQQNYAKNK